MSSPQDLGPLQDRITAALVASTKGAAQLAAEDLPFQRSLDPTFGQALDRQTSRLLNIAQGLIRTAVTGSDITIPQLHDVDDVDNHWRGVVDVVDTLLEQADVCLDEYTGVIKRATAEAKDSSESSSHSKPAKGRPVNSFRNQNLVKPQLLFKSSTTNHETTPWKPLLRSKPHAIVPLDQSIVSFRNADGVELYRNPYEAEIMQSRYTATVYQEAEAQPYQQFETTSATFVDTPEAVHSMLAELKQAKEIAIDLEHHDARSYVGLVSLMQISTREKDWIVDTLKPWREDLQILNEVFADPAILKVFHGAFMDMVWLQRDLGIYVVGLFDTYHAARALGYPSASLASLLSRFIHIQADKQYQMADWRIRPLPKELFNYARSDTHYLLYIYDNMRNELIGRSKSLPPQEHLVERVLQSSKETALQIYERQIYDATNGRGPGGWYNMLQKTPGLLPKEQFAVFKAVHQWRDTVARQNDDSLNYVMPRPVLFSIARMMPSDTATLLSIAHPVSQPMRAKASELLGVINRAKEAGAHGPEMMDIFRPRVEASTADTGVPRSHTTPIPEIQLQRGHDLRARLSRFWGPTSSPPLSSNGGLTSAVGQDLRLALPLPPLTAEIFESQVKDRETATQASTAPDPGAHAEHAYVKERPRQEVENDGVFVVKRLGGGRKRKNSRVEETADVLGGDREDNTAAADERTEDVLPIERDNESVQQKKKVKKERKRLAKQQRAQAHLPSDDSSNQHTPGHLEEGEHEPFDYANAESVLHAKRGDAPGKSGPKAAFNPYAKLNDAPQGMRRSRKEKVGKSMTYRS
ncbi:MAG: exosome nuclease subunit [Thelocarpon superellum]|nr:MAG: exosome nuclease subunit [Thelocarpon superellum]